MEFFYEEEEGCRKISSPKRVHLARLSLSQPTIRMYVEVIFACLLSVSLLSLSTYLLTDRCHGESEAFVAWNTQRTANTQRTINGESGHRRLTDVAECWVNSAEEDRCLQTQREREVGMEEKENR